MLEDNDELFTDDEWSRAERIFYKFLDEITGHDVDYYEAADFFEYLGTTKDIQLYEDKRNVDRARRIRLLLGPHARTVIAAWLLVKEDR